MTQQRTVRFNAYPQISQFAKNIGVPISILDTETTGLGSPKDVGVVDFAVITVFPDDQNRSLHFETLLQTDIPLNEEASKVHGIYPEDLVDAQPFSSIAEQVRHIFENRIVSGFNTFYYDGPILRARVNECFPDLPPCPEGRHLDVRLIHTGGNRYGKGKLVEVAEKYNVPVINAHRAMGDVEMTTALLEAMIEKQGEYAISQYIQGKPLESVVPQQKALLMNP